MIQCGMLIEMVFKEFHRTNDIHKGPGIMDKVTNTLLPLTFFKFYFNQFKIGLRFFLITLLCFKTRLIIIMG